MSVEAPKSVEETPAVDAGKPLPEQPVETSAAPADTPTETTEATPAAPEEPAAAAATETTEEAKKDETVVEAVPASEGVLGYKEPGFLKYGGPQKILAEVTEDTDKPLIGNSCLSSTSSGSKRSLQLPNH